MIERIDRLCQMADQEFKHIHYYYNIGCKWRYKQMRYYQCRHNKNLKTRETLDRHCKVISNQKDDQEFDNENDLDIDVDDQTNTDKKYICDYHSCDKIYKSWFQLQRHRSQHYKVHNKPYLCDWEGCHNQFKKLKNLIIHRRLHTGERPFKCDIENCNKSFRAAHSLSSHRRTHNELYDKVSKFEKSTKN